MINSDVKNAALADIKLLEKVVRFKQKFYRCSWARYDEAKPGTMKLMPPENNMSALKDDYRHMRNMIFGEQPDFDVILTAIQNLEFEINKTSVQ